jgi:protein involved in polysaccharide export with SLBB domain
MVAVQDLTTEDIEDLLKEKIKLYENPQVSVKVREHASHRITVFGLVEKAGEKYMQREAIPLYVVRAEAIVQSNASPVVIKRANSDTEKIDLKDPKSEDILVFPGDIVEFKSVILINAQVPQFYYIGGNVGSVGQKDFYQGITLTQAILASGGLKKPIVKSVIIRRKNAKGLLSPIEFDLKAIKDGKQPDPILQAGDTIEISF